MGGMNMSMDVCHDCGRIVDTDNEPCAYIEVGNMRRLTETICVCERCREEREMHDEMMYAASAALEDEYARTKP